MRNFDLTPLFRSTVVFDRLGDLLDTALRGEEQAVSYPPYNIEKLGEDDYAITMAVAGFGEADIEITSHDNLLVVTGRAQADAADKQRVFLHKGIGTRAFERKFSLADHVKVTGASHEHGMLHIDLAREIPEAARPRRIEISRPAEAAPAIEAKAETVN